MSEAKSFSDFLDIQKFFGSPSMGYGVGGGSVDG